MVQEFTCLFVQQIFIEHLLQARKLVQEAVMLKPDLISVLIKFSLGRKVDIEINIVILANSFKEGGAKVL